MRFLKLCFFLGAGSVIHAVADEQDMRRMGGLKRLVPFTFSVMSIGSFALMGFPFLTGFYSKDVILKSLLQNIQIRGILPIGLVLLQRFSQHFIQCVYLF